MMQIKPNDMDAAVKQKIITAEQAKSLWQFWQQEQKDVPSFRFIHILYYLGGLIAIAAVTIYVTNAWDTLKGLPLLILSFFLALFGFSFTHYFLQRKLKIPGISKSLRIF